MLLNCGVGEDSWESFECKVIKLVSPRGNQPSIFIGRTDAEAKNSYPLATWCEELTHLKRPWCWERLKAGGEGDNRGWDCWMAPLAWWTWVSKLRIRWWTGKLDMLQLMGLQRVRHDWATELNWTTYIHFLFEKNYLQSTWSYMISLGSKINEKSKIFKDIPLFIHLQLYILLKVL